MQAGGWGRGARDLQGQSRQVKAWSRRERSAESPAWADLTAWPGAPPAPTQHLGAGQLPFPGIRLYRDVGRLQPTRCLTWRFAAVQVWGGGTGDSDHCDDSLCSVSGGDHTGRGAGEQGRGRRSPRCGLSGRNGQGAAEGREQQRTGCVKCRGPGTGLPLAVGDLAPGDEGRWEVAPQRRGGRAGPGTAVCTGSCWLCLNRLAWEGQSPPRLYGPEHQEMNTCPQRALPSREPGRCPWPGFPGRSAAAPRAGTQPLPMPVGRDRVPTGRKQAGPWPRAAPLRVPHWHPAPWRRWRPRGPTREPRPCRPQVSALPRPPCLFSTGPGVQLDFCDPRHPHPTRAEPSWALPAGLAPLRPPACPAHQGDSTQHGDGPKSRRVCAT